MTTNTRPRLTLHEGRTARTTRILFVLLAVFASFYAHGFVLALLFNLIFYQIVATLLIWASKVLYWLVSPWTNHRSSKPIAYLGGEYLSDVRRDSDKRE